MALTREEFLALDDMSVKEITIPEKFPVWGGRKVFIRALTRGEQDAYLRRQMGDGRVRTNRRETSGEVSIANMYGHDAWLCVRGVCDESGKALFKDSDIQKLEGKSGGVIGWLAQEIVLFSGMGEDVKVEDEVKN